MRKLISSLIAPLLLATTLSAQDHIEKYKGKTYIFDSYEQVTECSPLGLTAGGTSLIILKGALFTVEKILPNGNLVIHINLYTLPKRDSAKYAIAVRNRALYNFKTDPKLGPSSLVTENDNVKFFLLSPAVMVSSTSEYTITPIWDITFGTFTTPFKFRMSPFLFTTNLNLGTSLCFQKPFATNFSWGIIGGLSLSSIILDSFSTKGTVMTSSERPAITPSLHGMIGYKMINLVAGFGWDFINKTSTIEQSWIYQGKMWIGIGIGVNLFTANNNTPATTSNAQRTSN